MNWRMTSCGVRLLPWRVAALTLIAVAAARGQAAEATKEPPRRASLPPVAAGSVNFEKDVEPLLARHCYSCHGPEKHKSGLRLDRKADALAGGDSGKVILPGKSAESILIQYVAGLDPDTIMPPKGERLTVGEIGTLRAWIDAGAPWPEEAAASTTAKIDHWAFKAPARAEPPTVTNSDWVRNPIDAFVLARLERETIGPSPEADRSTLIRRLSLDLLGLVPTLEETAAFVNDKRPDAYERLVDRLLDSPHFGERWGRHWLDLARYADSDGYEKDSPRPFAYLFRDWVIDAINRDLPFDQFTIEQLAGDVLPDPTEKQKIATGFHRQTLTNREGGVDKEEFRSKATVDRVSTTGTVWLGLTIGCAECHTHKYDPITQREFYQLYAFFNNASEKDIPAPQPPELAEYNDRLKDWERTLAELDLPLQAYLTNVLESKLPDWERSLTLPSARWTVLKPGRISISAEGDETLLNAANDHSISPRARDGTRSRFTIEAEPKPGRVTGFRLEALADPGKPVGRGAKGDFALSEFTATVQLPGGELRKIEWLTAKADFAATNGPATNAMDGDRNTGWSVGPNTAQPHVIVFEPKEPLDLPRGAKVVFSVEQFTIGLMNRFRIAATTSAPPIEPSAIPDAVVAILDTPADRRNVRQKTGLARYFAEQVDAEGIQLHQGIAAHHAKKPKLPDTTAAVLVADERRTHVHIRGDFLRPGDEVRPATPGVLHSFQPRGARPDRLDLARWLVDPANPLTARVTVNHIWKNLFGRALVTTVDDFGTRGERPSHPGLLDWLAVTFSSPNSRGGLAWSRKEMIRLIVGSSTYRQSAKLRPELVHRDPGNSLLARQNRYRLEAENIRDIHLAASGLLNRAIGGPSIRPALPADIAALGYANSVKWPESKGAERYRRGLYIFFQRTVPYPMLTTFDAPDSNTSCTRRERSNTPLQALTLLNDPVFFECAQALAKRVGESPLVPPEKIRRAFQLCLAREPDDAELDRLLQLYSDQMRLVSDQPENASRIAGVEKPGDPGLEAQASLVAVCRVIMNLDEFVTRE